MQRENFFQPITRQSNTKAEQMWISFDTGNKTALAHGYEVLELLIIKAAVI